MLREELGSELFWKGVNLYIDRHKFGSVETIDLMNAMEQVSGRDLKWFFDQWVYGAGAPNLDLKQVYNTRQKTLTITMTQIQPADAITPAAFHLPLDVDIKTGSGESLHKLDVTKRSQVFTIKLSGKPISVKVDEGEKIPLKNLKIRPMTIRN